MSIPLQQPEPVRVFLSYASEDEDIMIAFSHVFDRMSELSGARISTIYDKKSFDAGLPVPLIREISDKLYRTDYLVILYAGTMKKTYSWPGTELGIFFGFIRADERERGTSDRKIIAVFFDEKPPVDWGGLGLHLEISNADLRLPKEQFKAKVSALIAGEHNPYENIINTLTSLGGLADERFDLARSSDSMGQLQKYVAKRVSAISNEIVPDLMERLHESFSRRVKKVRIEQRLVEFQIPKGVEVSTGNLILPDETQLIEHGDAFSILTKNSMEGPVTWRILKSALLANSECAWITAAIERSVVSAVAADVDRDDEQIIRTSDKGRIYRLIVTRRFEFFDGSAVVHMYLIPALRAAFLENSDAAITLGFINVATRYREIFINPNSELSVRTYHIRPDFDELQSRVKRSIRQLLIIEDEIHVLRLDKWEAITTYLGELSEKEAARVGEMNERWKEVRSGLVEAAELVLKTSPAGGATERDAASDRWVKALERFVVVSDEINSTTLNKAIANLRTYLSLPEAQDLIAELSVGGGSSEAPSSKQATGEDAPASAPSLNPQGG